MLSYREMQNLLRYARDIDTEYTGFIPKLNSKKEVLFSACCDYQTYIMWRNDTNRKHNRKQSESKHQSSEPQKPVEATVNGVNIWEVTSDSIYFLSLCQRLFGSDKQNIKKTWRSIVMTYHPDHGGDHNIMCRLNEMYQKVMAYC